jgi:hypothetical protein
MPDTRTVAEVLEQEGELVEIFQENSTEELSDDDAANQVKDFVGEVQSAIRTLKDSRTSRISDLAEKWGLSEDMVEEAFDDYEDTVE